MRIDFVAGHDLLAQGAKSVFASLKEKANCTWRIGRPINYTGADAIVLIDHAHHHSDFYRWPKKFYLMHDLGDIDDYQRERKILRQFTAVIVPDEIHAKQAKKYLSPRWWRPGTQVFVGGWPKYDEPSFEISLPDRPTILYAPSWAGENEWKMLLPVLEKLAVNVVIKNHPYATAPGEEVSPYYQRSRAAADAMEKQALGLGIVVAPRDLNICTLFPHVDVAISDQSSVLVEFLPFGVSIETGAHPGGPAEPEISKWYPAIQYQPLPQLLKQLNHIEFPKRRQPIIEPVGPKIANFIWEQICA